MLHSFFQDFKTETKAFVAIAGIFVFLLAVAGFFYISSVQAVAVTSVQSGPWSSPATWNTGAVPGATDSVTITAGHTVVYDVQSDAVLGEVSIEGTLFFSRTTNTRLKTNGNILVKAGGFLDMGTEQSPIPKSITAEVIWQLTQAQANAYVGGPSFQATDKGLWAMSGSRWEVHGAPLVRTWSKLAQNAAAGTSEVVVENDMTDWYVGGDVIITTTSTNSAEEDVRKIVSLELLANGNTRIVLDRPLQYSHSGAASLPGNVGKGEVGLLTRNILFTTDIDGVDEKTLEPSSDARNPGSSTDSKLRKFAHTMYMNGSRGNLQYAEFKYLGHFAKLARYPIHTHLMLSTSRGKVIRGNAISYSGHHVMNLHESNHILVEDNVGYNFGGSGYFVENEIKKGSRGEHLGDAEPLGNVNNTFIRNLGVGGIGYLNTPGMEAERAGIFWLMGNTNSIGNVAVGGRGHGINGIVGFPDGGENPVAASPAVLLHNEAHGNRRYGLFTWSGAHRIPDDYVNVSSWRNGNGFNWASYTAAWHLHQMKFVYNLGEQVTPTFNTEYFMQDSVIASPRTGTSQDQGILITKYVPPNDPPGQPNAFHRNTFIDNKNDISNFHSDPGGECIPGIDGDKFNPPNGIEEEFDLVTSTCPATYLELIGNQFGGKLDFGHTINANTRWKIADYKGPDAASLPQNFWVHRKDQANGSATQTPLSAQEITAQSFYYAPFDALVTPISPWADQPPQVSLNVSTSGKFVTLTASPTDDKGITRVEFFQDSKLIGVDNSPPYTMSVDLSGADALSTKRNDNTFIQFEAENGVTNNAKVNASASEVFGGQYIEGGGTATYTVTVPESGRYRFWGRVYFLSTSGQFKVTIDGKDNSILGTQAGQRTNSQGQWHWIPTGYEIGLDKVGVGKYYNLAAGTHVIQLTSGSGFRLDSLVLAWDNTVFPFESPGDSPAFGDRKFTYFYARAYDGVVYPQKEYEQRAYSNIVEIGPEVILAGRVVPTPTLPSPSPTPVVPPPTPPALTRALGDLNLDGKINILDVSILLSRWGKTDTTSLQEADISTGFNNTSAGRIDIFDANKLMANWTG